MRRYIFILLTSLVGALLSGCGTDKEFRINGTVDGMGTGNLKLVFYSGDAVQTMNATAIDGKFMVTGRVEQPTAVRIYNNTGAIVGRMAVEPGETVDVNFNLKEPWVMKADGNDDSEYLAEFMKENTASFAASDRKAINKAIEAYVSKYPSRGVSGLLLTDYYTPTEDVSHYAALLGQLEKKPRQMASTSGVEMIALDLSAKADSLVVEDMRLFSEADTMATVKIASKAHTIVMITDHSSRMTDSIAAAVSRWKEKYRGKGGVRIVDISVDPDTANWHRSLHSIAPEKIQDAEHYWAISPRHIPGLERVSVGRVPWFVMTDSTGIVSYSGSRLR